MEKKLLNIGFGNTVVAERVVSLGAGSFDLFVDDTHREHDISDVAVDSILNVLAR